jgi:hypothetical protein
METTVRVVFASLADMKKAAEALNRQGVLGVRPGSRTGGTLPDIVEFAAAPSVNIF